jgi:hypothetical protein
MVANNSREKRKGRTGKNGTTPLTEWAKADRRKEVSGGKLCHSMMASSARGLPLCVAMANAETACIGTKTENVISFPYIPSSFIHSISSP